MSKKKTTTEYIQQIKDLPYEVLEEYQGNKIKIAHKHITCGYIWAIRPSGILTGKGCPKCAGNLKKTTEEYKKELQLNFLGIEVLEEYTTAWVKVLHRCYCGNCWYVAPSNILQGHRCSKCMDLSQGGFKYDKPAILYYLSVKQGEAYKIGITNHSVNERYSNEELQDITIIEEWEFVDGQKAYEKEQEILKKYKHLKYLGEPLLKSGNTELFLFDVLGLDTRSLGGFNG